MATTDVTQIVPSGMPGLDTVNTSLPRSDLRMLLEERAACVCVSFFMPFFRGGPDIKQNPLRLKNMLKTAEKGLVESGLRRPEAAELLEPVEALVRDGSFWHNQSDGLAIFRSKNLFRYYHLPYQFKELVVVSDRFHIKPILFMLSGETEGRFNLLTLSMNQARLYQCTRNSCREVDLTNIAPRSLEETLKYDEIDREAQFHYHSSSAAATEAIASHGKGPGEYTKINLMRYFQQIDRGLNRELLKEDNTPLVIAGVDYILPIYREANTYANLLEKAVTGSPEKVDIPTLHKKGWTLARQYFATQERSALKRYRELVGRRTSHDVQQIPVEAYQGRVETLFVATGVEQWGRYDEECNEVILHQKPEPCDSDMLDFAAAHTILNRGTVYALEPDKVPDGPPVAAVLRYVPSVAGSGGR